MLQKDLGFNWSRKIRQFDKLEEKLNKKGNRINWVDLLYNGLRTLSKNAQQWLIMDSQLTDVVSEPKFTNFFVQCRRYHSRYCHLLLVNIPICSRDIRAQSPHTQAWTLRKHNASGHYVVVGKDIKTSTQNKVSSSQCCELVRVKQN